MILNLSTKKQSSTKKFLNKKITYGQTEFSLRNVKEFIISSNNDESEFKKPVECYTKKPLF